MFFAERAEGQKPVVQQQQQVQEKLVKIPIAIS
jgi:hypothetical protein